MCGVGGGEAGPLAVLSNELDDGSVIHMRKRLRVLRRPPAQHAGVRRLTLPTPHHAGARTGTESVGSDYDGVRSTSLASVGEISRAVAQLIVNLLINSSVHSKSRNFCIF